jgi:hypothetical protein
VARNGAELVPYVTVVNSNFLICWSGELLHNIRWSGVSSWWILVCIHFAYVCGKCDRAHAELQDYGIQILLNSGTHH